MPVQEKHNIMEMYISFQATVQCFTWKINYISKCSTFCYTNNSDECIYILLN